MKRKDIEEFVKRMMEMQPRISEAFKFKLSDDILKLDLSMPHIMVLWMISGSENPPIISEIGKSLSISFAMMTRIIDRIELKQLVNRIRDSNDRRIIRIELTAKGKEVLRKFQEFQKKQMISFLNRLGERDRESFMRAMEVMRNILLKYGEEAR